MSRPCLDSIRRGENVCPTVEIFFLRGLRVLRGEIPILVSLHSVSRNRLVAVFDLFPEDLADAVV